MTLYNMIHALDPVGITGSVAFQVYECIDVGYNILRKHFALLNVLLCRVRMEGCVVLQHIVSRCM